MMEIDAPALGLSPSSTDGEAVFLQSLLNKNLRITTADSRMFWGSFKCTDPESNVVLKNTYEYRHPTAPKPADENMGTAAGGSVKLDMTSRFLGLVVVPGRTIVKIEVEEFASQMRSKEKRAAEKQRGKAVQGFDLKAII